MNALDGCYFGDVGALTVDSPVASGFTGIAERNTAHNRCWHARPVADQGTGYRGRHSEELVFFLVRADVGGVG